MCSLTKSFSKHFNKGLPNISYIKDLHNIYFSQAFAKYLLFKICASLPYRKENGTISTQEDNVGYIYLTQMFANYFTNKINIFKTFPKCSS